MKERPKGNYRIVEFNKESNDIILVIPTMDVNGKYALTCRNEIFKGLHIIFVESGYNNYYFNYAHNCNEGIKKALEYNPKWIIVSNDDMYKIDDVNVLVNELYSLDENKVKYVFTNNSDLFYHSSKSYVFEENFLHNILFIIYKLLFETSSLHIHFVSRKVDKKFNNRWHFGGGITSPSFIKRILKKISLSLENRHVIYFINPGTFLILSGKWCYRIRGNVFNENYINGMEDVHLGLQISKNEFDVEYINYSIGDLLKSSLGNNWCRSLRDLANYTYFNSQIENNINIKNIK
jgi:hypothetical protein